MVRIHLMGSVVIGTCVLQIHQDLDFPHLQAFWRISHKALRNTHLATFLQTLGVILITTSVVVVKLFIIDV